MLDSYIAGVDEAGRGAWAGNVVAAAVVLPQNYDLPGLNDSKKLSPKRRELLFEAITTQAVCWAYGQMSAEEIDQVNIHQATLEAMRRAVLALTPRPTQVLVDGAFVPTLEGIPARAIVGGDASEAAIAAASIVAKVVRDRQLIELDKIYPQYGFASHKGYGTAKHSQALDAFGITPIHRKSYAPIKKRLGKKVGSL